MNINEEFAIAKWCLGKLQDIHIFFNSIHFNSVITHTFLFNDIFVLLESNFPFNARKTFFLSSIRLFTRLIPTEGAFSL